MSSTRPDALRRHGRNALQFGRFALVGGTGVVVNLVVLVLVKRLGPLPDDPILALHPTAFHVRWYHVYSTAAFLVANLWNFQLNRWWTFRSSEALRLVAGVLAVPRGGDARPGDRARAADHAHAPRLAAVTAAPARSTTPPACARVSTGPSSS